MARDHEQTILDHSLELFLHYGFRRTTMADIARSAGISRPTLYGLFPSKDAVFSGVIENYKHQLNQQLEGCFQVEDSLSDKLYKVLAIVVIEPFTKFVGSKFKRELMSIEDEKVQDQVDSLIRQFDEIYASCFESHPDCLERLEECPEELGRLFNSACLGVKDRAQDVAELDKMLRVLIRAFTAQ